MIAGKPLNILYKGSFIAGGFWEIARFAFLALSVSTQWMFYFEPFTLFIFLWFGSGQLIIAAGFFLIPFYPKRAFLVRRLCILAKAVSSVPGILIVSGFDWNHKFLWSIPPIIILIIDFLFILFLVSYRSLPQDYDTNKGEDLPEISETIVEEE